MSSKLNQIDISTEYLKDNFFKIISAVSLSVGGILFLIYFFHIGYMPTLDVNNSLHLVFAMAVTGFWLMLMLVGLLILPSLFWGQYQKDVLKDKEDKEQDYVFLLLLAIIHSAVISMLSFDEYKWYILLGLVFILAGLYFLKHKDIEKKFLFISMSFIVISISLFSWIPILVVFKDGNISVWIAILVGIIVIVLTNALSIREKNYIQGFFVGFVLLIVLMIFTKNYVLISQAFMKNLHLGGYKMHIAHIKKESCDTLKNYDKTIIQSENNISCILSKLDVLLSLGRETLIKIPTKSDGNVRVVIPSNDIISYSWK